MSYSQQTWHDLPVQDTPISAARLGHIEAGIGDVDSRLTAVEGHTGTVLASCRLATTGPISLVGSPSVDGTNPSPGDRILVKDQADATTNGIYLAASLGWSRDSDMAASAVIQNGAVVTVRQGNTNATSVFEFFSNNLTSGTFTVGTHQILVRSPINAVLVNGSFPTYRSLVNLTGSAVTATDDSANSRTNIAINGGNYTPVRLASTTTPQAVESGLYVMDGVQINAGDRILYKDFPGGHIALGIYVAASGAWTRASDMPASGQIPNGGQVYIRQGASQAGQTWSIYSTATNTTASPLTVGTDMLSFSRVGGSSWAAPSLDTSNSSEYVAQIPAGGGNFLITLDRNYIIGMLDGNGNEFFQTKLCITQDATGGWYSKFPGSIGWSGVSIDGSGQPMLSTEPKTVTFITLTWLGSAQGYVGAV